MRKPNTREAMCKVISIEEAKAAARTGRRRAGLRKSNVKSFSVRKVKNFERWLKEIYPELARI